MTDTIYRTRVTWARYEKGQSRISHPYLWIWADDESYERSYDTRGEATAARTAYKAELAAN